MFHSLSCAADRLFAACLLRSTPLFVSSDEELSAPITLRNMSHQCLPLIGAGNLNERSISTRLNYATLGRAVALPCMQQDSSGTEPSTVPLVNLAINASGTGFDPFAYLRRCEGVKSADRGNDLIIRRTFADKKMHILPNEWKPRGSLYFAFDFYALPDSRGEPRARQMNSKTELKRFTISPWHERRAHNWYCDHLPHCSGNSHSVGSLGR